MDPFSFRYLNTRMAHRGGAGCLLCAVLPEGWAAQTDRGPCPGTAWLPIYLKVPHLHQVGCEVNVSLYGARAQVPAVLTGKLTGLAFKASRNGYKRSAPPFLVNSSLQGQKERRDLARYFDFWVVQVCETRVVRREAGGRGGGRAQVRRVVRPGGSELAYPAVRPALPNYACCTFSWVPCRCVWVRVCCQGAQAGAVT